MLTEYVPQLKLTVVCLKIKGIQNFFLGGAEYL